MQYKTLMPIRHNGKPYKEGESVEMQSSDAESLIELGAIVPLGSVPPPMKVGSPDTEDTMIITQQVSGVDPESVDIATAPISAARKQQQKKPE